jgi:hypothetical protein
MTYDWIGWLATAVVTSSYFFKPPAILRRIQATGAVVWLIYGLLIHSLPVVIANLIVAGVAGASSLAKPARRVSPAE